mmetsp:Transcript_102075/g.200196  ORF Transcript_102075/g.200196 Transcript_102075/m.200196 type:complete len:227 (-) Transcript_102075:2642-3322(-)
MFAVHHRLPLFVHVLTARQDPPLNQLVQLLLVGLILIKDVLQVLFRHKLCVLVQRCLQRVRRCWRWTRCSILTSLSVYLKTLSAAISFPWVSLLPTNLPACVKVFALGWMRPAMVERSTIFKRIVQVFIPLSLRAWFRFTRIPLRPLMPPSETHRTIMTLICALYLMHPVLLWRLLPTARLLGSTGLHQAVASLHLLRFLLVAEVVPSIWRVVLQGLATISLIWEI